jgi:putative FmdB family regulatory protein
MPIYAFRCAECGHDFDRLQKLSDPDPEQCPACGAAAVRRQVTAPAFRLAGSGWYETDFKKEGDRKRNLVEGGEGAAKDAPKDAPKAEAKPAADRADSGSAKAKSEGAKPASTPAPASTAPKGPSSGT